MLTLIFGLWMLPLLLLVAGGIIFMFLVNAEQTYCAHCGDPVSPLSRGVCDRCMENLAPHQPKQHDGEFMKLL